MVFSNVKQGDLLVQVKYQMLTLISHVVYYELWNLEIVILQPKSRYTKPEAAYSSLSLSLHLTEIRRDGLGEFFLPSSGPKHLK